MSALTIRIVMLAGATVMITSGLSAQATTARDHAAVLELGGAGEWGLAGGSALLGGSVGVEVTPIEHWLELEASVTALAAKEQEEVATDLLFKKPFTLAPTIELMAGLGPEVSWRLTGPRRKPTLATELALDFMFWPARNLGWYLEPDYSLSSLRSTSDRSLGVSLGLIIGIP